ncbi:MAG TPA: CPBP family intramembrane glutamic endopeptidase [Gemmatimonadaceae bacterium]|nr:CPBP family intramembrane glutamic endopeptidase [Gemmatimonadaceae bacterium]
MSAETGAPPPRAKLPAPVRLLVFVVVTAAAATVLSRLVRLAFDRAWLFNGSSERAQLVFSLVVVLALLAAHVLCLRVLDREPWSAVFMDRRAARPSVLGAGALLGAVTVAVPTLLLLGGRWFHVVEAPDGSWLGQAWWLLLFLAPAALWEELAFRGYLFSVLRRWLGPAVAIGATSIVFGLIHLSNPGAEARSTVLVILAGVFLGGIMLATRSLYAAWAAHLAWNWMMAAVLHTPVSGAAFSMPDYQMVETGPDWATGGPWGPEGGAAAALSMLAALYLLVRRAPGWWRPDDARHSPSSPAPAAADDQAVVAVAPRQPE